MRDIREAIEMNSFDQFASEFYTMQRIGFAREEGRGTNGEQ
jgi:hypothetical protein